MQHRRMNPWWPLEQKLLSFTDILCALSECPESERGGETEQGRQSISNTYLSELTENITFTLSPSNSFLKS